MTAVIRLAEARTSASVMINSSIRLSLAGYEVDWMMKTSSPRTFSSTTANTSLSAKRFTWALVSGMSRWAAMAWAKLRFELPASSFIDRSSFRRHRSANSRGCVSGRAL